MPELPEVETTVRGLAPVLAGRRIAMIEVRRPDLRRPFPVDLRQRMTGATVTSLGRRAKYGLIETDRGDTLVFHLGMSGSWRLDPAELGRIDVRIDVDRNGHVTSHLMVEKRETLSMLRQDAPQLQRQLDDAGFKTGSGGLQFSLRDQSSSNQNNGDETGRNAQRLVVSSEDPTPAAVVGRTYGRMLGSSSGIDIKV